MTFADDAWAHTAGLRAEIDDLEFLAELADGTLDPAAFRFYLEQDALYLAGYAKALARRRGAHHRAQPHLPGLRVLPGRHGGHRALRRGVRGGAALLLGLRAHRRPAGRVRPRHPYARWVATYDGAGFQESTRRARELTDAAATPELASAMQRAFALATAYERDFWGSVPRQSGGSAGDRSGSSPA